MKKEGIMKREKRDMNQRPEVSGKVKADGEDIRFSNTLMSVAKSYFNSSSNFS